MQAAFRTTQANDGNVIFVICITFDLLYQKQSVVEQSLFQFELLGLGLGLGLANPNPNPIP